MTKMFCEWLRIFSDRKYREVKALVSKKLKVARKWSWLDLDNKLQPAKKKKYIAEEEQKKCKIIAREFNRLFRYDDLLVLDAGRYGFVKLTDYDRSYGFMDVETFRSSKELFEDLWKTWVYLRLNSLISRSTLAELDYEDIFKSLPPHVAEQVDRKKYRILERIGRLQDYEEQKRKWDFPVKASMQGIAVILGIGRVKPKKKLIPAKRGHYLAKGERGKCRKVASAFKDLYEHEDLVVLDAGKYGFVKLHDYKIPYGFGNIESFRNSRTLFEDLWEEWISSQLISLTANSPLEYLNIDDILESQYPQARKLINRRKERLMKKAEVLPQERKIKVI